MTEQSTAQRPLSPATPLLLPPTGIVISLFRPGTICDRPSPRPSPLDPSPDRDRAKRSEGGLDVKREC